MFEVNINFDDASRAWKANKIRDKYAHYSYKCQALTLTGNKCNRKADVANIYSTELYCKRHCSFKKIDLENLHSEIQISKLTSTKRSLTNNRK
jgi:hypothetical protein